MTNTKPQPVSATERVPVSFAQQMLCVFDAGDPDSGPFGPRHNITWGWRIRGPVDTGTLAEALDDVVARHEALRTRIVRDGDDLYQTIAPPSPAQVSELDLSDTVPEARDRRAEELIIELEGGRYGIEPLPLLRAVLGRFDEQDAVLVLIAHHAAVDGWSMQVLIGDLTAAYARRRGHAVADRPEPAQYRDYAVWERESVTEAAPPASRAYWRDKLRGGQMVTARMDHPRSANLPKNTSVLRYAIDADLAAAVAAVSKDSRSSPFMVLLAAYNVLMARRSGTGDIVVPTIGANRKQTRFQDTVGNFTNFIPLRTDLTGCATFRDVLDRTRLTCIEAYTREIPFFLVLGEAPELMAGAAADDQALIAFQVLQLPFVLDGDAIGDLELRNIPRRLSQERATEIPDGALWQLDVAPSGEINAYLGFNSHKFTEITMRTLADEFSQVLKDGVLDQHAPLRI
ncbi:condensation domain-containing protein [Streptosporangium sp. NBC_01756]|uniref:condensation domain-containing protein n=1 Tax=Streptosporangium sp. NBC_01756 TaxID=2975950 RepID=UPI002DDC8C43|nr:condensation domain-containing protein [Streptosporangium sp. NBC_01756]WSC85366.1 condensation domain-containing protein [Streptosporangium sp. NBC_01756]